MALGCSPESSWPSYPDWHNHFAMLRDVHPMTFPVQFYKMGPSNLGADIV